MKLTAFVQGAVELRVKQERRWRTMLPGVTFSKSATTLVVDREDAEVGGYMVVLASDKVPIDKLTCAGYIRICKVGKVNVWIRSNIAAGYVSFVVCGEGDEGYVRPAPCTFTPRGGENVTLRLHSVAECVARDSCTATSPRTLSVAILPKKHTCLFTNARDEPNIYEWCSYHLAIGFDRIHVFDHLSAAPIKSIDPRITVERIEWNLPVKYRLIDYAHALAKGRFEWSMYIDADEYLALHKDTSIHGLLDQLLATHPDTAQVCFNWLMFGSSGLTDTPDERVLPHYTKCAAHPDPHVKSLVLVDAVTEPRCHMHVVRGVSRTPDGVDIPPSHAFSELFRPVIEENRALLYHYYTQSYKRWLKRRAGPTDMASTGDVQRFRLDEAGLHSITFGGQRINDVNNTWLQRFAAERLRDPPNAQ